MGELVPSRVGPSRAGVLALVGIALVLGGIVGAVLDHKFYCRWGAPVWRRSGETWRADQIAQWSAALALDAEQRAKLARAVDRAWPQYRAIFAEVSPRRKAIDQAFRAEIRCFLTEAQRSEFDRVVAETEARCQRYYGAPEPAALARPIVPAARVPSEEVHPAGPIGAPQ